ncbi:hypothetical protein B0T26DRAFT_339690 [Lasiosphaeria miniovina]|uniref:Uncharacterized protein n=1 Tax=Lasiosphaeria miniovina TaxID=1954250 RepID=A0AA40DR78_9PEZI|nr:uncharacterized protein B0T26DRAFT_339690 [Lasiosphaeria miniovina]KAK0712550.1 hypothetical protein B0T26DRAFT_339690 [Lasiosphaeria miniovina]
MVSALWASFCPLTALLVFLALGDIVAGELGRVVVIQILQHLLLVAFYFLKSSHLYYPHSRRTCCGIFTEIFTVRM